MIYESCIQSFLIRATYIGLEFYENYSMFVIDYSFYTNYSIPYNLNKGL